MTTAAAEEMDLTQYLPSLDGLQSSLATWMKVLVIAGPIVMLLLGLYYFFLSPKEANYRAGYRFRYAMSKVGVWQFTQKLAGITYGGLGLILSIVMLCLMAGFNDMNTPDLVWYTVKCLLWQIILALVAVLVIDVTVVIRYNYNGRLRSKKKKAKNRPTAEDKPTPAAAKGTAPKTAAPAKRPTTKPAATAAKRPTAKPATTATKRPAAKPATTAAKRPAAKPAPAKRPAPPATGASAFRRPDDL